LYLSKIESLFRLSKISVHPRRGGELVQRRAPVQFGAADRLQRASGEIRSPRVASRCALGLAGASGRLYGEAINRSRQFGDFGPPFLFPPLLPILGRPIAFLIGLMLAHIFAFLCAAEVALAAEVVDP
jgi:hypothetical protein